MASDVLKPDIYALQQSVIDVLSQVRDLMGYASEKLESESKDRRYLEHRKGIENEITKVKNLELRMAIVAPMKAGKSTIINAIVGQDILPSRNTAMTTLPTEIVFSKNVTEPQLSLVDTQEILKRSWLSLKNKIKAIGVDLAIKEIADYPHLQQLLEEIAHNSEIPLRSEVSGAVSIQTVLVQLNDIVRLCSILAPSDNPIQLLLSVPRIEVPFWEAQSSLKLNSVGKLVIVDTPGPNEAGDLKLENVVKRQLEGSSIILMVLDYTQLNNAAAEKVKNDVDEVALIKGRESIYVLINKIDLRRSKADMDKIQVLEFVNNKFGIEASSDRVFEISASRAAYASNFRNELRLKPDLTEPQSMETAELLARQAFGDMWDEEFPDATMDRMKSAADRIWSKSGFADFLEKAVGALMLQAAPLSLFSALNDARERLTDLQNSIKIQKGTLGENIQALQTEINELENDLRKLVYCQNALKAQIDKLRETLNRELDNSFGDMQRESSEQIQTIFGDREFTEAGLGKKFSLELTRLANLVVGRNYEGKGIIEFKTAGEAEKFVEDITASVKDIVNGLMGQSQEKARSRIQSFHQHINTLLKRNTQPIIQQAKRRLKEKFNVSLDLPSMFTNEDLVGDFDLDIQARSDSRNVDDYKTVKKRHWYTLWLWEHEKKVPVTRTEKYYSVSITEVKNTVNEAIKSAFTKVNSQISEYIEKDFQQVIQSFFDELNKFLKGYEDDLQRSIEAGRRTREERESLKIAFDEISKTSTKLFEEINSQKLYVEQLMPSKLIKK